jgi:peptidoglycan/LPS O-acetylase OafA/YrhL
MTKISNHYTIIDYLRGIAILAVVAIHTSANFVDILKINMLLLLNALVDLISGFAVPLFIFISGFVLSIKYKGLFSEKNFYIKRAKSVIPQYIIFSTIYILLSIVNSAINGSLKYPGKETMIFDFLTASSCYHLWYFILIIQFYIFHPLIMRLYENFTNKNRISLFIFLTLIIQQVWLIIRDLTITYFGSGTNLNSTNLFINICYTLAIRFFFSHIFYFVIGIYVCQNYEAVIYEIFKTKKIILSMIIIFTGVIFAFLINCIIKYGTYSSIPPSYFIVPDLLNSIYFPLIFAILLFKSFDFSNNINKHFNWSKIISLIGVHSFGIYLIHPIYMEIIRKLIFPHFNVDFNHPLFYPSLFISTLILSYFSVYLISYLPYSEIIIGTKKAEDKSLILHSAG